MILTVSAIGIGFTSFCLLMTLIVRSGDTTVSGDGTAEQTTPVSYPTLPSAATTEQITTAYQPRVFFIADSFTEHRRKQGLFGPYVEQASRAGNGSGIMIANDTSTGLILTNRHVVEPGFEDLNSRITNRVVRVKNPLQSSFVEARVVAVHLDHDLALLLVEQKLDKLESIRIVRTEDIRQGEPAVVLGNPLGLEYLVSSGIISAKREGALTTTCSISPGNSGGPLLLNRHGYLAGIATAFYTRGQNVNLAIPAEVVVRALRGNDTKSNWNWLATDLEFRLRNPETYTKLDGKERATAERLAELVEMVPGE